MMKKWIAPVLLSVGLVLSAFACRLAVQNRAQESDSTAADRIAAATAVAPDGIKTSEAINFSARKPEAAVGLSVPAAATAVFATSSAGRDDRRARKEAAQSPIPAGASQTRAVSDLLASSTQIPPQAGEPVSEGAQMASGLLRSHPPVQTQSATRIAPPAQPSLPLAFQDSNPAVARLNETQQPAMMQLKQQFVSDIGGPEADSSTPEYLNRWRNAQPASDTQFRGFFGQKAFLDSNLAAGQQDAAQSQPAN